MNPDHADQTSALDQLAAALRDLRTAAASDPKRLAEEIRAVHHRTYTDGAAPISVETLTDMVNLAAVPGFDEMIAEFEATVAAHLPHIRREHIGAALLDVSRLLLSFRSDGDQVSLRDMPMLLAFAGQRMYGGGAP